MSAKLDQLRMTTKARTQGGVAKPGPTDFVVTNEGRRERCWAEKRSYYGALMPSFLNCSKPARKGFLTCRHHADREDAAQKLKLQCEAV